MTPGDHIAAALDGAPACAVSWLALEQRALGELDPGERLRVDAHIAGCPRCAARAAEIAADVRPLRPLPVVRAVAPVPVPVPAANRPPRRWWSASAGGLALAAAALLAVGGWRLASPGAGSGSDGVKGDHGVTITLVRERDGAVVEGPAAATFRAGDRFRVLLTCAPSVRVVDVVVVQGEDVAYPLAPEPVCGNRVGVAGAFGLTGRDPALVCAVLADPAAAPVGCVTVAPDGG